MRKALFLDRDGVINKDFGYVHRYRDIEYIPNIFKLCRVFQNKGFKIIIITNQSGIGRGFFSEADLIELMSLIRADFKKNGIHILDYYFCPHILGAKEKKFDINCNCRKPKPGMIFRALKRYSIEPGKSFLIGDNMSDVTAGIKAKLKKVYLLGKNNLRSSGNIRNITALKELIHSNEKADK